MVTKSNDVNVELRTTIPDGLDRALAQVVELTGISKATLVRQAIAAHLAGIGIVHPSVTEALQPTKTGGRGLARHIRTKGK